MSHFPNALDSDTDLPAVNDNITEIGGDAINALRDAVFNIEQNIGLNANGATPSIAAFLGVSFDPYGNLKPSLISSAIASMGLIYNEQVASNAGIQESKLELDYPTATLDGYIKVLKDDVQTALGWIATTGIQLEPHLLGIPDYRHSLNQIDVTHDIANFPYLQNKFRLLRDNTQAYSLINDINNEFLSHQWADGSISGAIGTVTTNNGSSYTSNFAHTASGIFIDPTRFENIPETNNNLQLFADYMDQQSILSLGSRTQNLFANGISVNSRSSSLTSDGYGQSIVPHTPAIAYLEYSGRYPDDSIDSGDDIIQFEPQDGYSFDEQFSLVKVGDIVTINYGADGYGIEVQFIISEKKYVPGLTYIVRIAGKNIAYSTNAVASITRSLFNNNKYGVLACATGVSSSPSGNLLPQSAPVFPSLIVGSPRGAQCLGLDFTPDEFNESHYLLYLVLYPDGNPIDGYTVLPAIDVTGNAGTTPGSYTLDSIVAATNNAFRYPGFNYRFIAFSYRGEFGIMLADSYNNAGFSIVNGVVNSSDGYDQTITQNQFPNNVIDVFAPNNVSTAADPLGFGPFNANVSSPLFQTSYSSAVVAEVSTKIFVPLRRNSYYVNGTELSNLNLDVGQALDAYGDGYWVASISTDDPPDPVYGPPGHLIVSYVIAQDLSTSGLKVGKTLVVQPADGYFGAGGVNYGRFVISNVQFTCNPVQTVITVYDGVHAAGGTPVPISPPYPPVLIYFGSDSVSFNGETSTDIITPSGAQFKRYFEVYVDQNGDTFTHERGRFSPLITSPPNSLSVNGITLYNTLSIANSSPMDIVAISPKLRGYLSGSVTKITLSINNFNASTGIFDGYLSSYNDGYFTNFGPTAIGKLGEVTRFYDETSTDYIDVLFNLSNALSSFSTQQYIDIQLFPSLELDETIMLISSCQVNDSNNIVSHIKDRREFGNTSEEQFTTSALNYISAGDRLLHFNGVIRGFDISSINNEYVSISGGLALVNGNLINMNDQVITIPKIQEVISGISYPINFALCVNSVGELIAQPITDPDDVLGAPSIGDRVMTVRNFITGNSYVIDSNLFDYILNNRKDLTVLYVISSNQSGNTLFLTRRDVRRYAKDSDSIAPAVLTSDNSQGNFKTLDSALNWLKFNSTFQDTLQVKGSFSISGDPGLDFPLNINGVGASSSLTFSSIINISNVNFSEIGLTLVSCNLDDVVFTNSIINVTGMIYSGILAPGSKVSFVGCTINVTVNQAFAMNPNLSFRDCIINVNVPQAFVINSGLSFDGCTFNYTYNPVGGTPTYSTSDLVNAGSGLMYTNITGTLDGLSITNCTFNNSYADHFPFISLQLGNTSTGGFIYSAIAQNITIANNTFSCIPVTDDRRAVIAITSTITASTSGSTYPAFPKLVDTSISGNVCNYDQMILVSTARTIGQPITGSMLVCVNCNISKNICGTIGFITAADVVSGDDNSINANVGAIRDKSDQLSIESNSCKLITNLDSVGQYIVFDSNWVNVGTGSVSIAKNTCNWISAGVSVWSNGSSAEITNADGIIIRDNRLSPANPTFLASYQNSNNGGFVPPQIGIALGSVVHGQTDYAKSQSVISGNILNAKTLASQLSGTNSYFYSFGIRSYASAIISENTISNVCSGSSSALIYLYGDASGGPNIICSDNILTRGSYTVAAYVQGASPLAINAVSITDNIFDSTTVDGTNTSTGLNLGTNWAFFDNYNQALEDISAGGHSLTDVESVDFVSQTTPLSKTDSLYVLNDVLGFDDGHGNFNPISFSSGINYVNLAISSNQTIAPDSTYNWFDVDTTGGAITITLPTISSITPIPAGRFYYFNDATGQIGTNSLTISIAGLSGNLLYLEGAVQPGGTTVINWNGASGLIYTDGNNSWYVIPFNPPAPLTPPSSIFNSGITVGGLPATFNSEAIFNNGALITHGGLSVSAGGVSVNGLVTSTTLNTDNIAVTSNVTVAGMTTTDNLSVNGAAIFNDGATFNNSDAPTNLSVTCASVEFNPVTTFTMSAPTGGAPIEVFGAVMFNGPITTGIVNSGCIKLTQASFTSGPIGGSAASYFDNSNSNVFQITGNITEKLALILPVRTGGPIMIDCSFATFTLSAGYLYVNTSVGQLISITAGGSGNVAVTKPSSKLFTATNQMVTLYCDGTQLFVGQVS